MADLTTKSETFVILARSTKGAATAQVILDATAAVSNRIMMDRDYPWLTLAGWRLRLR